MKYALNHGGIWLQTNTIPFESVTTTTGFVAREIVFQDATTPYKKWKLEKPMVLRPGAYTVEHETHVEGADVVFYEVREIGRRRLKGWERPSFLNKARE